MPNNLFLPNIKIANPLPALIYGEILNFAIGNKFLKISGQYFPALVPLWDNIKIFLDISIIILISLTLGVFPLFFPPEQ